MTTQRNRCDGCDDVMPNSNTANQIKVFFSLLFYCRFIIQCISIEKKKPTRMIMKPTMMEKEIG